MSESHDAVNDSPGPGQLLRDLFALLTFRATRERLLDFGPSHLALGLLFTWLVGMGRYWDNPRANLAQHLGLGSLIYICVLASLLWIIFKPLNPRRVDYQQLLCFVSLTSVPAILYAIPVERFLPMETAATANVWFLVVVALWRVALLIWFMSRALGLRWFECVIAGLLPLTAIITALTMLNLEHVVFRLMAGIGAHERSANDDAYAILFMLTLLSMVTFPVLLVGYGICVGFANRRRKHAQDSASEDLAHQDDPAMWPYDRKVVLDIDVDDDNSEPAPPSDEETAQ